MSCEKIRVAVNWQFLRPEPGTDCRSRVFTGGGGALAVFASAKSQSHAPILRQNRRCPRRFRRRAKQLVFFIACLPIAA